MDGIAADGSGPSVDLPGGGPHEMASLPIPNELLAEIFLRLPAHADLVRASAACTSFRRAVVGRSFLRKYRRLHAPPLLGLLHEGAFHPAVPPHPSVALAAAAVALAADFSFSFLPGPDCDWVVQDSRDGRVLLDRPWHHGHGFIPSREIAVCDPLHRRHLLLPPVPEDLAAASAEKALLVSEAFLVPADDGDDEETSFRVMWVGQGEAELFAFIFSSSTGQWRVVPSRSWVDLFAGLISSIEDALFVYRRYACGCFYWVTESRYWRRRGKMKLLELDTQRMEFSIAETPPEAKISNGFDMAVVEADEGRLGIFAIGYSPPDFSLHYTIMQSNGEWQREKTISLSSDYMYALSGSVGRYLVLVCWEKSLFEPNCFTMDMETFKLERVCGGEQSCGHAYSNFPPLLLSSPTVSSGVEKGAEKEMLEQGCAAS